MAFIVSIKGELITISSTNDNEDQELKRLVGSAGDALPRIRGFGRGGHGARIEYITFQIEK